MSYSYRTHNQIQPHSELDFNKLVALENSLESFTRKSWAIKIPVIFKKGKTDYAIIDEENERVIYFIHGISQNVHRFNSSFQILHHWLCGVTLGGNIDKSIRIKNINKMVELIFNGSTADITNFRREHNIPGEDGPNLGWNVLHYPLEMGANGLTEFTEGIIGEGKYAAYEPWICYGVVSLDSHRRSNKQEILEVAAKFFDERGFSTDTPYWAKDYERSYEPIVLFRGKNFYKTSNFTTMVGINFGFDNGLSGYRVGLGFAMDDDQIAWLHPYTIQNHPDWEKNGTKMENLTWIHHKDYGYMESVLSKFLENMFDKLYDSYVDILNRSKQNHFSNQQVSRKRLEATHCTEFQAYQEQLGNLHDQFLQKYGSTNYTHFKTWLGLAGELDNEHGLAASRARWIAECILTRI